MISIVQLLLRPGHPLRFVLYFDLRVVALAHDFTINQLPQDYLPISTCGQNPLYMVALRTEHLWREIELEERIYHISMVTQYRHNNARVNIVDFNVRLLLERADSDCKVPP